MTERFTRVWCDGSALATGSRGGIAYVAVGDDGVEREDSRTLPSERITNNKAEILAAAWALDQIEPSLSVLVRSDSEYLVKGWNDWLKGWIAKGWKGGKVKNRAEWERLIAAADRHGLVKFEWVRGHNGDRRNERCDVLAGRARQKADRDAIRESYARLAGR